MKNNQSLKLIGGVIFLVLIVLVFSKFAKPTNKSNGTNSTNQPSQSQSAQDTSDNPKSETTISDSPYLGDKTKAKVAIVEFSDYECPYCKMFFEQTFDSIVSQFVDTNKAIFVYRDFLGVGLPAAEVDSNSALCVKSLTNNEGYFKMARLIYKNTGLEGQGISKDNLIKYAQDSGADQTKFTQCLDTDKFKVQIQKDTQDAQSAGVTGTPSFVIGTLSSDGEVTGELLSGAQPITAFNSIVNKYLK